MSLHIGINLCPYAGGCGGAETYLRNLVSALSDIGGSHRISLFIAAGMEDHFSAGTDFQEIICGRVGQSRPRRVWLEQTVLPSLISRHDIDLIFSNYVSPVRARCRQIVNVHDMLYKVYPEYIPSRSKLWYWRAMVPASIRRAETVMTVSRWSAHDIRRFFPNNAHKVIVGTEAVARELTKVNSQHLDADVISSLGASPRFVLCTAGLDAHKNIRTLVRAFEAIADNERDLTLVLTDPCHRKCTHALDGAKAVVKNRIILTGRVPYDQLAPLYRQAVAHVTASRFEGFGLSVIEAQHFGCPSITSMAGALPEVAGNATLYFHPDDWSTLATHLHTVLSDERRRDDLIARGRCNVQRYDWQFAARQFLDICERPEEQHTRWGLPYRRDAGATVTGLGSRTPRFSPVRRVASLSRRGDAKNGKIRKLPLMILMPHSRCNCRCVMCDIWKDNSNCRELSLEQISTWTATFAKLGVRRVMLTGGEPLMHGHIERLLRLLHECDLQTTLLSTGLLLRQYTMAIVQHCADVVVSLDGSRGIHDAIRRVPGAFDRLADGVAALNAVDPSFPITGRCTIQRGNFRDWPNIIDAAREIGLRSISFQAADTSSTAFNHPSGWERQQAEAINLSREAVSDLTNIAEALIRNRASEIESGFIAERPEELRRIVNHFAATCGESDYMAPNCNVPWVSAVVEADGAVKPCFFHRAFGNINEAPLIDILNCDEMVTFRKTLSVQDDPICRRCVCSLYYSPRRMPRRSRGRRPKPVPVCQGDPTKAGSYATTT